MMKAQQLCGGRFEYTTMWKHSQTITTSLVLLDSCYPIMVTTKKLWTCSRFKFLAVSLPNELPQKWGTNQTVFIVVKLILVGPVLWLECFSKRKRKKTKQEKQFYLQQSQKLASCVPKNQHLLKIPNPQWKQGVTTNDSFALDCLLPWL